ncbi:protein NRT1/ PTR FAMILY 8.3-like isoform X2 [Panicum virgatum]|uniref:Uncharacterized protein n=1 Tax=Panicum virgatum TaxID=38727 RepID=A0A8T0NS12_PANVG|nr:protein NRT1/ PTR FAMILY 8.3-like isoform X2 [Panicum virgatum]KAG2550036.1 hypothetical protein PVAP13_9KG332300 [Panicum virgatum]
MEVTDEERPLIRHLSPQDEASQYTSDGTVDINDQPARKQSTGNWRACFMILGTEFTECMAFFAIGKNLVTFLTAELHETNVDAARNVSTWIGSCFLTPVIGAFLADTYWGMLILTVSASVPLIVDVPSNSGVRRVAVYLGLYLVALGTGGVKPCSSALGADQFDGTDPVERATKGSFNWYYFCVNIGSLLSGTVLVWVQEDIGWGVGFAVPMVLMVSGLAVFVAGRKVYRYKKLGASPLTRAAQVVVAAVRNYRVVLPEDTSGIEHSRQFRFFDKAAIVVPSTGEKGTAAATSPWRLCTASQVEELKMLPVWASMVLVFAATAQMSSTLIEQGAAMDNRVGPFAVPPASLATFDVISVMVCIPVYDAVLVPLARRATGKVRGLSQLQRIGAGLALSAAGMAYAALVEARKLALARGSMPAMNIMWQPPAFAVLGAGEAFASIGILEFFYDESPDGMKSLGNAFAQLAIAAGSYLNSAVLGAVAATTARRGDPGWIPENLNQGHLDYFWMMAALCLMNLAQFAYCSIRYRGKTIC